MSASFCRRWRGRLRRKGFILMVGAMLTLLVGVPAAGLAIDVGLMYLAQTRLQAAVDFACVAGARALSRGADDEEQRATAQNTADTYFNANFRSGYLSTRNLQLASTAGIDSTYMRSVTTTATVDLPFIFMRVFRMDHATLRATAKATRRDVNVMIVMDRSKSLADSGACTPLKNAAINFMEKFAEGRDNLGLITFATSSRVDYPMQNTFKSAVRTTLNNVVCAGGTSSAQAVWQGYREIVALQQTGALNVIVFFTDGRPTAVTETFPILSSSTCSSKTAKLGVLTVGFSNGVPQAAMGLYVQDAPPQPFTQDLTLITNRTNCRFASSASNVASDVSNAPTTDYWGNSLTATGFKSVITSGTGLSITNAANIQNFSINAADHAALRVRRGDPDPSQSNKSVPGVTIYTIGLGDIDEVLLKRMANDPSLSPNPVAEGAPGRYIYAQNATELDLAFTRVASELMRIAQ
jgi:Mg-chelatase subunit ChlD